jgi:hypothetical protein
MGIVAGIFRKKSLGTVSGLVEAGFSFNAGYDYL